MRPKAQRARGYSIRGKQVGAVIPEIIEVGVIQIVRVGGVKNQRRLVIFRTDGDEISVAGEMNQWGNFDYRDRRYVAWPDNHVEAALAGIAGRIRHRAKDGMDSK